MLEKSLQLYHQACRSNNRSAPAGRSPVADPNMLESDQMCLFFTIRTFSGLEWLRWLTYVRLKGRLHLCPSLHKDVFTRFAQMRRRRDFNQLLDTICLSASCGSQTRLHATAFLRFKILDHGVQYLRADAWYYHARRS